MTRTELLEKICPTDNTNDCCLGEHGFNCDDCDKTLNRWLDEYDKQIRADERNNVLSILKKTDR